MVFNGKLCKYCGKAMLMDGKYQKVCSSCKRKNIKIARAKLKKENFTPWKNRLKI
jgi:recombinational DNA repair protein RecT